MSYTTVTATLDRQTIEIELTEDDIEAAIGFTPSSLCEDEVRQIAEDEASQRVDDLVAGIANLELELVNDTLWTCLRRWRGARKVQAILRVKS